MVIKATVTAEEKLPVAEEAKPEAFKPAPAEQVAPVDVKAFQGEKLAPEALAGFTKAPDPVPETKEREYPRWRYSKTEPARVVASKDEEKGLKGTWYDVPQEDNFLPPAGVDPGFVKSIPTLSAEGVNVPRNHLLFQAETIGLVVDPEWSNATLRRMIHEMSSD